MPSEEHILPISTVHYSQPEQQQPQTKVCAKCLSTLVDPLSDYQVELDAHICASCREQLVAIRTPPVSLFTDVRPIVIDIEPGPLATHHEQTTPSSNRQDIPDFGTIEPLLSQKTSCSPPPHLEHSDSLVPSEPYDSPKSPFSISNINVFPPISPPLPQSVLTSEPIHPLTTVHQTGCNSQLLDPLVDITRIRVRSQGQHCLYPGARFTGTQKSGRNSYDVNVTIVDVDFASSFLCGYLRIRGLTDDWPELTTYFDAEIIGSRHGFLTKNWGATESEDMIHWSRFPAFRHVKHELRKPQLTMSDRERGAVFMRWKERFLVPDHRVQDINGASFAGFYYVCVDFNPPSLCPGRTPSQQTAGVEESEEVDAPISPPAKSDPSCKRRDSSSCRRRRSPSRGPRQGPPVARMSGFYFHQNSEPYQQLTLDHVLERASSNFEFC